MKIRLALGILALLLAPALADTSGLEDKLEQLKTLREKGLITEVEYARTKQQLLENFAGVAKKPAPAEPRCDFVFEDTFDDNPNWQFNGDYARPNFRDYPGIAGWENGRINGKPHDKGRAYLNIVDGVVFGCSRGYGTNPQSFEPTSIHRQISLDGSKGFSVSFRAVSDAAWPNAVIVYLMSDWKRGKKKPKYYAFRIYGESSNHCIDVMSSSLDSFSDLLYRHRIGSVVNSWHEYTFSRSAAGEFTLHIDGKEVPGFKPPADATYKTFDRIAVDTMRVGSKIDWIRVSGAAAAAKPPAPPASRLKRVGVPETGSGRIYVGDHAGGVIKARKAGWDGDFDTFTEADSNGDPLKAITWETTELYHVPKNASGLRLHAKVEHAHWQSHAGVYVYNHATEEYDCLVGGEKSPDGVTEKTVDLDPSYVKDGEIKVRAVLFAKHRPQAYARYYDSEILYE